MMGTRLRTGWVLAVIGALALTASCSLNPQPIPPGFTQGTGADQDASTPTTGGGGDGSDGATKTDDGGFISDDAGDASDGGDEDAADSGDT